jgi:hypothetical protein
VSRGWDDERDAAAGPPRGGGSAHATPRQPVRETPDHRPRDREQPGRVPEPYADRLDLPLGTTRETVAVGTTTARLNGEEARLLATLGTFRAVPVSDLGPPVDADTGALRHLRQQGLADVVRVSRDTRTAAPDVSVAVLTARGRDLLDTHRRPDAHPDQAYHAGLVKPAELAHDAALYRVYREAAHELATEGRHVTRVVLDYELKAEYQRFLNRPNRPDGATLESDRAAFAQAHGLTVGDGHLELPDLRLEYEGPDGARGVRDVELVTEHYSRAQLAGKTRAGFAMYRLGRRGGRAQRGGTPHDPHHIDRVLG